MERAINVVLGLALILLVLFRPWSGRDQTGSSGMAPVLSNEEYIFLGVSVGNP